MLQHAAMGRPIINANSRRKPSLSSTSSFTSSSSPIRQIVNEIIDNNETITKTPTINLSESQVPTRTPTIIDNLTSISKVQSKNIIIADENSNPNNNKIAFTNSISKTMSKNKLERVNSHQSSSSTSTSNGLGKIRKIESTSSNKNNSNNLPVLSEIKEDNNQISTPLREEIERQDSIPNDNYVKPASRPRSKRRLSVGGPLAHNSDLLLTRISEKEKKIVELQKEVELLRSAAGDLPKIIVVNKPMNPLFLKKEGKITSDKYGPLPCATHGHLCETCCQIIVAPKWARVLGIPQTSLEAEAERKRAKKLCKKQKWGRKILEFIRGKIKTVHEVELEIDEIINQTILTPDDNDEKRKLLPKEELRVLDENEEEFW